MALKEQANTSGLTVKKRCNRCLQYLRADGTCQNPKCVKYVPPKDEDNK